MSQFGPEHRCSESAGSSRGGLNAGQKGFRVAAHEKIGSRGGESDSCGKVRADYRYGPLSCQELEKLHTTEQTENDGFGSSHH